MRQPLVILLGPLLLFAASRAKASAPSTSGSTTVEVTVTHGGTPLAGAVVRLDLNDNGVWDEHLQEPQEMSGPDCTVVFDEVVSMRRPAGDDPDGGPDWRPSRILAGNLRGAVGARAVEFDFVLPAGIDRASLDLYDLRGRRLAQTEGRGDLALNVPSGLPAGVYFVRLSAGALAPVAQRITSVGRRAQAIRAREVSAAEAIAAGWAQPPPAVGKQKNENDGQPITLLVSHLDYGAVSQGEVLVGGGNAFTVAMPDAPAGFVYLSPGRFVMGSPEDEPGRESWEGPQHEVTLTKGFYMSQHEVTEELWAAVLGAGPSTSQLPKGGVGWDSAVLFCNELSIQEGLTPAYTFHAVGDVTWHQDADGFRLPTEAEWEYACRAGSATAFANGPLTGDTGCAPVCDNLDALGWYCGNTTTSQPVGTKLVNAWGLYDMHGNVFEWAWCGPRTYTSSPQVDPVYGVTGYAPRVLRGGSGSSYASRCRSAHRAQHYSPDHAFSTNGFRLVRTAFAPAPPGFVTVPTGLTG